MASNQTSNYGLNQWAAADKVLREEFNQDNAKIDEALAQEKAERIAADQAEQEARQAAVAAVKQSLEVLSDKANFHLIQKVTAPSSASRYMTVDLGEIIWEQWKTIHVLIDPYVNSSSARYTVTWCGNANRSLGVQDGNTDLTVTSGRKCPHIMLFPLFSGKQQVGAISMGVDNGGVWTFDTDYSETSSIILTMTTTSYSFLPGSYYVVYGEK